jgi:hypothetical protein
VINAEQDLLELRGKGRVDGGRGKGGKMTQTLYAHVNKRIIKKTLSSFSISLSHI